MPLGEDIRDLTEEDPKQFKGQREQLSPREYLQVGKGWLCTEDDIYQ